MPLYNEVVAALKGAGITPEALYCEEFSSQQVEQVKAAFPHYPVSLNSVDWEVESDSFTRIFCFEGYDQEVWIRVRKYTGGGGEFDEATFEHIRPVQTTTYEPYPTPQVSPAPAPPAPPLPR